MLKLSGGGNAPDAALSGMKLHWSLSTAAESQCLETCLGSWRTVACLHSSFGGRGTSMQCLSRLTIIALYKVGLGTEHLNKELNH